MPAAAPSTAEREDMLDRMLTRLALAEDDDELEPLLAKILPYSITSLASPSASIRKLVLEILSHVNKRVKNTPEISLPFSDLWRFYNETNASAMVKNFCIMYIEMSFERLSGEDKTIIAPDLLVNIANVPSQHQEVILQIVSKAKSLLFPDSPNSRSSFRRLLREMEKEATKVSFSFSVSSKASSRPAAAPAKPTLPLPDEGGAKPQFLTVFDSTAAPNPADAMPVIEPIPNVDQNPALKRMKNLLPLPTDDDDPSAAAAATTRFILDTSTGDAPAGNIPYGLTLRTVDGAKPQAEENGFGRGRSRAQNEDFMNQRFKDDVKDRPEDRGIDEFNDVKVEDFAAAVLRGYGWKQGQAIGRNKQLDDAKVFEHKRKGGSEGLGYNPSVSDLKKRRGSWVSNGASEKVKEREKVVRVISGKHMGLKGKVLKTLDDSEFILKLLETGEEVKLWDDMVVESGSVEEEKFLRNLKKTEDEYKGSRREIKSGETRREDKKGNVSKENSRSKVQKERRVRWLTSHIRVRIVSKDIMGGKLYLKKGKVIDVVGPTTCDISLDGTHELVQGVDQEMLETALPKVGGSVLVLYGKHKGIYGKLMDRNTEKETGLVRDADSHNLIKVRLDEIAEYLGDPSYLGY